MNTTELILRFLSGLMLLLSLASLITLFVGGCAPVPAWTLIPPVVIPLLIPQQTTTLIVKDIKATPSEAE